MVHHIPNDFDSRIYGPQRIAAVVETLKSEGIAPSQALAGSGLDEHALYHSATRISYRQVAIVFRNALQLSTNPLLALNAGARMHVTSYGMYGYGLLSSPSHENGLKFSIKYNHVMGPVAGPVDYEHDAGMVTYIYEVFLSSDPYDALYRFAMEFAIAAHFTLARYLYDSSFVFSCVNVAYPEPAHANVYQERFGCPGTFGQQSNRICMDESWLAMPVRLPDPVTHGMIKEVCHDALVDAPMASGVASRVQRILVEQMPWRFPNIESMAQELSMHPRTLRRRLETQGTSYREILTTVRRGLAIEYLRKTHMTTEEIASRLGYSDASNFRHAFIRWTGKSPQKYRMI